MPDTYPCQGRSPGRGGRQPLGPGRARRPTARPASFGGERGRGTAGETPLVAAAGRRPERLWPTVVEGLREREVGKLAEAAVEPGAEVVSDGPSCWPAAEEEAGAPFPPVTRPASGPRGGRRPVGSAPRPGTSRRRSPACTTTSAPGGPPIPPDRFRPPVRPPLPARRHRRAARLGRGSRGTPALPGRRGCVRQMIRMINPEERSTEARYRSVEPHGRDVERRRVAHPKQVRDQQQSGHTVEPPEGEQRGQDRQPRGRDVGQPGRRGAEGEEQE